MEVSLIPLFFFNLVTFDTLWLIINDLEPLLSLIVTLGHENKMAAWRHGRHF
jgi:hypothetical protein